MSASARVPHRNRQTKIVATLGPTSNTPERIRELFLAGVDMFRLNFSHGTQDDHRARTKMLRDMEKEFGRPVCILGDLQGPKLRLGKFAEGAVNLTEGQKFRLDLNVDQFGTVERAPMPHPEIFKAAKVGGTLLLDDGKVRLRIDACGPDFMDTTVMAGSRLSDRKGVNVPDMVIPLSALTPKDRSDLEAALDMGVDWIAISFVQKTEDVIEAQELVKGRAPLLVKLEKPSAIDDLEKIIELADGVMVARGDLGVEMPPEVVPSIQKRIIRESRRLGRPVIVATQMLESMITAPTPTRAEASDVANAVYDGADAVMLSAETASGSYPIEAVTIMNRIIVQVEADSYYRAAIKSQRPELQSTTADAITAAARQTAETVKAVAIVTYTTSGSTTLRAARERPSMPILCMATKMETARRMALSFGVHAVHTKDGSSFSEIVKQACDVALRDGLAENGQTLVITAGVPFGTPGRTNVLRIATVGDDCP